MLYTLEAAVQSRSARSEDVDILVSPKQSGLIVNADDWGRDQSNTNRIYQCIRAGSVTAVSAMVFMEDSARAAGLARQDCVDASLHLNFTTGFSSPGLNLRLREQQQKLAACLKAYRFSPLLFHPLLQNSFEYLVRAQIDEFTRLYDRRPDRIDGHHHMHLCANLLFSPHLLPHGIAMRRSFTFRRHEKSWANRFYRRIIDAHLAKTFSLTDYLFSILPMLPERLERIYAMARRSVVELETHPVNIEECRLLTSDQFVEKTAGLLLRRGFADIPKNTAARQA